MKLLMITQSVDQTHSNLGFFVNWLRKIAAQVDHLYVICLEKGEYDLPTNVTVLSLGKEQGGSHWQYLVRFYQYIFKYRHDYDHVLVHMNSEYVVLGGLFWRAWQKKVGLWYVHKAVNFKLWLAEKLVTKIFTTSPTSFRLKSKKIQYTGHGIDLREFENLPKPVSQKLSLLSVGRITESKDLKTIIKTMATLQAKLSGAVVLEIAGAPLTEADQEYLSELKALVKELEIQDKVYFLGGLGRSGLRQAFARAHILLHASQTGSMDKVVLEALAAGRVVLTSSEAYQEAVQLGLVHTFPARNWQELAKSIEKIYNSGILTPNNLSNQAAIAYIKKDHNLESLLKKILSYYF